MEREILVANTKTQKRYKLTADVNTLGELKAVLSANSIDYEGMSFTEGISNVQLINDDSQLPHDLNYKGTTTNNLVLILTNTTKKIESGVTGDRAALAAYIKDNNLGDDVKATFGRNWTQVSTDNLVKYVNAHKGTATTTSEPAKSEIEAMADDILSSFGIGSQAEAIHEEEPVCTEEIGIKKCSTKCVALGAFGALAKHFADCGIFNYEDDYDDICYEIEKNM